MNIRRPIVPVLCRPMRALLTVASSAVVLLTSGCQDAVPAESPAGYFEAAGRLEKKGDRKAAIEAYSHAIALAPRVPIAYLFRGMAYEDSGDLDRAIADLKEATRLSPQDAFAHSRLGIVHEAKGDLEAALQDYTRAAELDPTVLHLVERGDVRRDLGDVDGAVADYSRAIQIDPRDDLGYVNRARAESGRGEFARAQEDFAQALKLSPREPAVYRSRAASYYRAGNLPEALRDFEQAFQLSDPPRLWDAMQVHLLRRRLALPADERQFAAMVRRAQPEWPQPVARFLLGEITETMLIDAARQGEAKTVNDHLCDAYYYGGCVRLVAGDQAGAARRFEQCGPLNLLHSYEWIFARADLARLKPGPGEAASAH